jgi:uncharacterized protein
MFGRTLDLAVLFVEGTRSAAALGQRAMFDLLTQVHCFLNQPLESRCITRIPNVGTWQGTLFRQVQDQQVAGTWPTARKGQEMAEQFAIVTGASSGIGLSLAKELAARGYDLAICSSGERLGGAGEELRSQGVKVTDVQADLATRDGVKQFWDEVQSLGRKIDVICINAGVGVGGLFAQTDLDAELKMVSLNCSGTLQLAKYVVEHMLASNDGKILFTSSIAGEMVAPREAVYAATKAFGLSFAHSLRYELRDTGISVTALQPGPTNTDFFHRAGMDNTEVGSSGKNESQPDDVARQGIEALLAGKDHVYAASAKTKAEGMLANITPGSVKGAMHEKMAKPKAS